MWVHNFSLFLGFRLTRQLPKRKSERLSSFVPNGPGRRYMVPHFHSPRSSVSRPPHRIGRASSSDRIHAIEEFGSAVFVTAVTRLFSVAFGSDFRVKCGTGVFRFANGDFRPIFGVFLLGSIQMCIDFLTYYIQAPRLEAASILGSVLSLPYMVSQAPSLDPRSPSLGVLNCAGAKDLVSVGLLAFAAFAFIRIQSTILF